MQTLVVNFFLDIYNILKKNIKIRFNNIIKFWCNLIKFIKVLFEGHDNKLTIGNRDDQNFDHTKLNNTSNSMDNSHSGGSDKNSDKGKGKAIKENISSTSNKKRSFADASLVEEKSNKVIKKKLTDTASSLASTQDQAKQELDKNVLANYSKEQLDLLEKNVCKRAIEKAEGITLRVNKHINFFKLQLFDRAEEDLIIIALNEKNKDNRFSLRKGDYPLNSSDELALHAEKAETGSLLVKVDKLSSGGARYDSYNIASKTYITHVCNALDSKEASYKKKIINIFLMVYMFKFNHT